MDLAEILVRFQVANFGIHVAAKLIFAFLLSMFIAWSYRKTHRGFSYSQTFSITLILLTVIAAFIFMLIQNNVAVAIGIFGAFSIIRFRTAVKDSRDTAFVFFALAVGLGVGVGLFVESLVGTIVIILIMLLLTKMNFGGLNRLEYLMYFVLNPKHDGSDEVYKDVLKKFVTKYDLVNVNTKKGGDMIEFSYHLSLKDESKINEFLTAMKALSGVEAVNLLSSKNDLEY